MGIFVNNQRVIPIITVSDRGYVSRVTCKSLNRPYWRWEGGTYDVAYGEPSGSFGLHPCVVNVGSPTKSPEDSAATPGQYNVENFITHDDRCAGSTMPYVQRSSSASYTATNCTYSNGLMTPTGRGNVFAFDGFRVSHTTSGLVRATLDTNNPYRSSSLKVIVRIFAYYLVLVSGMVYFDSSPLVCNVKSTYNRGQGSGDNDCTLASFATLLASNGNNKVYSVKTTGTSTLLKSDLPYYDFEPMYNYQVNLQAIDMPRLAFTLGLSSTLAVWGFGYEAWPMDRFT